MKIDKNSLIALFNKYPFAINDRLKLVGLLKDFFPLQKMNCNIFMMAYDLDIINELKENEINDYFIARFTRKMINEYGIKDQLAYESIILWCETYGKHFLNKDINFQQSIFKANNHNIMPNNCEQLLDRKKTIEGHKYSKSFLVRNLALEKMFNIVNVNYTIREGYDCLDVIGEIEISNTSKEWLLCLSVFDSSGRLIRYDTCEPFDKNNRNKIFSFDYSFNIPKSIYISKLLLYPMKNPLIEEQED